VPKRYLSFLAAAFYEHIHCLQLKAEHNPPRNFGPTGPKDPAKVIVTRCARKSKTLLAACQWQ
jgi:hypothetical protein